MPAELLPMWASEGIQKGWEQRKCAPPSVTNTREHLQGDARESRRWPHSLVLSQGLGNRFHPHPETPDDSMTRPHYIKNCHFYTTPHRYLFCDFISLCTLLCYYFFFLFLKMKKISLGEVSSFLLTHTYFPPLQKMA